MDPSSNGLLALAAMLRVASLQFKSQQLADELAAIRQTLVVGSTDPRASHLWGVLLDAFDASAWDRWGKAIEEIRRLRRLTDAVARLDDLSRRLSELAPLWTNEILENSADPSDVGQASSGLRAWDGARPTPGSPT